MINFNRVTEETLENVLEIVNSNYVYNTLENGIPYREIKEIRDQFLNQNTDSFIISVDNQQIGIIDFLKNHPKDHCPWIGLLMIHGDFHSKGYGKAIYQAFEDLFLRQTFNKVRIGIIQENVVASRFWTSLGFEICDQRPWEGKIVFCLEKQIRRRSSCECKN
ncbi:GNAT family N-acetyltransferase [Lederbergia wuyishanensis]|uniref:GNAT superfamily N-acetyltransferase n=1 Tax=Lederbergia wuyishanensis TaxID=1347903 RepID=A0ABU0D491_9BACI|nr:GNAT family N-acetyltransferase [Lederbergia wuyishanensis]MCJ8008207.1 GNAT family N-acetyltransferase [Lederbergia wuyishanensis]MDQ0343204.1 GNAT superfamily N-acetyltransferase [Lederbergia wuyishanensis]